MVYRCLMSI